MVPRSGEMVVGGDSRRVCCCPARQTGCAYEPISLGGCHEVIVVLTGQVVDKDWVWA
jgi:hypothetical protein